MILMFINDIHLTLTSPAKRKQTYFKEICAKLEEIKEVAERIGSTAIVLTGDIFHRRNEDYLTLNWFLNWIKECPCPVHAVIGNHDYVGNLANIRYKPMGSLIWSGLCNVNNAFIESENTSCMLFKKHWKYSNDVEYYKVKKSSARYNILATHAPFIPDGVKGFGTVFKYSQIKMTVDYIFHGHHHNDYGIQAVNGIRFVNLGALSRGSLVERDLKREIKIPILYLGNKATVKQYKLKNVLPIHEVISSSEEQLYDIERLDKEKVDLFLSEVGMTRKDTIDFSWVYEDVGDPVKTCVKNYIERHIYGH